MPFEELSRLALRYDAACRSPLSCPRDREILRTKLQSLEEIVKALRTSAAKAIEISEAEQERLLRNLEQMRKNRAKLKAAKKSADTVIAEQATVQDMETLLAYTRFILGILEKRETPTKEGTQ